MKTEHKKKLARLLGMPDETAHTYTGKACRKCGSRKRYKSHNRCVSCVARCSRDRVVPESEYRRLQERRRAIEEHQAKKLDEYDF